MNETLRPCPFCGGTNVYLSNSGGIWKTTCGTWQEKGCGATAGIRASEDESREAWNRRTPEPAP